MKFDFFILAALISSILSSCTGFASSDHIDSSLMKTRILPTTTCHSNDAVFQVEQVTDAECLKDGKAPAKKSASDLKRLDLSCVKLTACGFCPGDRYTLYMANTLLGKNPFGKLVANNAGQLVFADDKCPLSNTNIALGPGLIKGEQFFFVLESSNQTCLTVSLTPKPIEFTWNDGAYICASIISADADAFAISGHGFQPNETLKTLSETCNEKLPSELKADSNGTFFFLMLPSVINVKGAPISLTVQREKLTEVGTLNYFWGTEAKKPTNNK